MRALSRWSLIALLGVSSLAGCSAEGDGGGFTPDAHSLDGDDPGGGGSGQDSGGGGSEEDAGGGGGTEQDAGGGGMSGEDSGGAEPDGGTESDGGGGMSGGTELCDNELDDNGDGVVDEGCTCLPNTDGACWAGRPEQRGVGACRDGRRRCTGDEEIGTWTACEGAVMPSAELCDSIDNDCDGMIDEGCTCPMGASRACYSGPPGTVGVGECRLGRQTCEANAEGMIAWGPCVGEVRPTNDICDRRDNNCDGRVDEACACTPAQVRSCYGGPDRTAGVGPCRAGSQTCRPLPTGGSAWGDCTGEARPASEVCNDSVDNDCDGAADCMDPECATATNCVPACMPGTQRFDLRPSADVLFVVDRSSSMSTSTGDGRSRWVALRTAVGAVLPGLDGTLHMGLWIYPFPSGCTVATTPNVALTQPSASALLRGLDAGGPSGSTPTLTALRNAQAYLTANRSGRPRFLVLATDGEPNCSGNVDQVVSQLTTLRTGQSVDTFVLGIPGTSSTLRGHLNRMADAGGRPRAGTTRFYEAGSTAEFESTLRAITAAVGCSFGLARPPAPSSAVTVTVDGATVPRDRTNGWDFGDAARTRIEFFGAACTRLSDGRTHAVSADYSC